MGAPEHKNAGPELFRAAGRDSGLGGEAGLQVWADALNDGFGRGFAHEFLEDRAVSPEQDIRRQGLDTELPLDAAVGIQPLRPIHPVHRDERTPSVFLVILADANHDEIAASIDGLEALEAWQGAPARTAPGSPKVQQDDLSAKLGEERTWGCRAWGLRAWSCGAGRIRVGCIDTAGHVVVVEDPGSFSAGRSFAGLSLGASNSGH